MMKRETYLSRIRPFIGTDLIKILTGIRRSSKFVMLELIQEELTTQDVPEAHFIKLNFERMSNASLCTAKALYDEVAGHIIDIRGKSYLFLDEIQEVEDWEKCVNSFRVEFNCEIYITGSNAKLLSGELATSLAGKYVELDIYPFSFQEYSEMYSQTFPDIPQRDIFREYLTFGGMPFLGNLRYEKASAQMYLQDLLSWVVLKDVIKRHKVRDVDLLERIIAYMFQNAGKAFSSASISKYLKNQNRATASDTVLNYMRHCLDAFLFYRADRQALQGQNLLTVNEKYYVTDHGLREAVFGSHLEHINYILENIVYMELRRRGYQVTVGKAGTKEVDSVCEGKNHKLYIQVTYLLSSDEATGRQFGALESIGDDFLKYALSLDEFDMSRVGIKHKNIRDFLLMPEWN